MGGCALFYGSPLKTFIGRSPPIPYHIILTFTPYMLIHPYSAHWAEDFLALKQVIVQALPGLQFWVEHVGSTAVPGLAAKPIIDVDVVHEAGQDFVSIKARLLALGYEHRGDQGIAQREVFKRTGQTTHPVLDTIRHHLYVCPVGSPALEQHLLFRDYLRTSESARKQYETLKYAWADQAQQDQKAYAALKERLGSAFIEEVMAKAKSQRPERMDQAAIDYILGYFSRFMSHQEVMAWRHSTTLFKKKLWKYPPEERAARMARYEERNLMSSDPAALALLEQGLDAFRRNTAERIAKKHANEIFYNRCLKCNKLARTPKAKQCRFCGHDWH